MIVSTKSIAALALAFMVLTASANISPTISNVLLEASGPTNSSGPTEFSTPVIASSSVPAPSTVTTNTSVPAPPLVSNQALMTFYDSFSNCSGDPVEIYPTSAGNVTQCVEDQSNCGNLGGAAHFIGISTQSMTTCFLFSHSNCKGKIQNVYIATNATFSCVQWQLQGSISSFMCLTGCGCPIPLTHGTGCRG